MPQDVFCDGTGGFKDIRENIIQFKVEYDKTVMGRFFSPVIMLVSLKQYLTRFRRCLISLGIKEGFAMPHIYRPQVYFASLRSVLFPFYGLVYLNWERNQKVMRLQGVENKDPILTGGFRADLGTVMAEEIVAAGFEL